MTGFPLLTGPLAPLAESLVPQPAAGALPVGLLLQPGGTAALLAVVRRLRPGADERALVSLWSRWYFVKLIPPVLFCGLLTGRSLPLDPAETGVLLGANGLPQAIALPHAGEVVAEADPLRRFAPLVRQHVAAVVERLAAEARLAPRILWNNAAVYADWALRRLIEDGRVLPAATGQMLALVEAPRWPDGTPNPFHAPVHHLSGPQDVNAWRRQCCLKFRLPGEEVCRTCPRLRSKPPTGA